MNDAVKKVRLQVHVSAVGNRACVLVCVLVCVHVRFSSAACMCERANARALQLELTWTRKRKCEFGGMVASSAGWSR